MEISNSEVNFLDTTVHLDPDRSTWTDLYSNPTGSHNYLRFESSPPRHCMQDLPYSQFLRVRRICTREEVSSDTAKTSAPTSSEEGTPQDWLDSAIARAGDNHHKDLTPHNETVTSQDEAERHLFAITTYHPTQMDFRTLVKEN